MNGVVVLALRRPYTFVVLSICILIFGVMAIFKTPTDVFPNIKIPVIAVVWAYAGLLPTEVSGRITYMYERQLTSNVEGIEHIESHSYYGSSIIKIFLQPGIDLAAAEADIDSISQTVTKQLPPDISPPMVMRLEASSVPVAMLKVTADNLTPADLYNLAKNKIRPYLVTIPGAILPHPYGGNDKQLLVSLDKQKMMARHLTAADVHAALGQQSIVLPAGDMKLRATDWLVQTNATPLQVEAFNNIPIKRVGNATIYMRDVADVRLGGPPQVNAVLVDGKQSVLIVVMKSGEASTLEVVDGIKKAIPKIEEIAPPGTKIELLGDASVFVEDSIIDVLREMALASVLTGIVVLLFLGSWRATVIIATSIPLSILSAIICLHWAGQTINVMTLGGLALAVGILVDDATVMIENIDTHIEMGKPLETAIIDAANQIVVPTFVSTLAIIIVWVPLFELTGVAGFLFTPMAEAVMFAMIASFILSRTLVPTMAKYLLAGHGGGHGHTPKLVMEDEAPSASGGRKYPTPEEIYALAEADAEASALAGDGGISHFSVPVPEHGEHSPHQSGFFLRIQQGFERGFQKFKDSYNETLTRTLVNRKQFVTVFLAFAVASMGLFYVNGQEFFPEIKSGILQMHMRAPLGTRIEVAARIASLISKDIQDLLLPGKVEGIVSNCGLPVGPHNLAFIPTPTIGSQDCDMTITLKDDVSPVWDYRAILRKGLYDRYPGTEFTFQPADLTAKILNFGTPSPIDVQINGGDPWQAYNFAREMASRIRKVSGAADVMIQQTMRTPTLLVEGNRSLGLGVNLTEKDIAENIVMTLSGSQQIDQQFWADQKSGNSYQINVYTPQPQITRMQDLLTVPVNKTEGEWSPQRMQLLGSVATVSAVGTPGVVTHGNIMPLFDIFVSAEGRDLGGVLADVKAVGGQMEHELPRGVSLEVHGQAETMHSAYLELIGGLVAAVVLIYLLIVVNFQSWLDPFIIITALPGALAGIAWSLFLTHTNLSVPALTGAIMCMGTATANSILVVAYARERMDLHGDAMLAALEAGYARIRPVIMTASAMIIGMLPMSMSNSQNAPLGRAVIGGLAVATFATLLFVPCVYAIVYLRGRTGKESV